MSSAAFLLAGLVGIGGLMGYVRKGSVASAVAGTLVAAGYAYSGLLLSSPNDAAQGRILAMATSGLLGSAMAVRFVKTVRVVPLALTLVGVGAFTYFAVSA
jgi:uncharacterized membrane protein (UPF0136 family)